MTAFCCRACQSAHVRPILALGTTPLANSLLREDQLAAPESRYPLTVMFCETCSLVQIEQTVPPVELFSEYVYLSSFSTTMLRHAETMANRMIHEKALTAESRVVEIASNDGYLLQYLVAKGVPVLGVEPRAIGGARAVGGRDVVRIGLPARAVLVVPARQEALLPGQA